jgi:hypothetical protein
MIHPRPTRHVFAALLLATAAAQEPKPVPCCRLSAPILIHFDPQGVMLNDSLLNGLMSKDRVRPILAECLAGTACDLERSGLSFSQRNVPKGQEEQPAGIYPTTLYFGLSGIESVPEGIEQKLMTNAVRMLQEQLKAKLVDQAQLPLQAQIDNLKREIDRVQAKLIAARRELLTVSASGSLDKMRERAADLDRRQRDLELDLRTEQSLQDLRIKLMAESRDRLQDVRARRADLVKRCSEANEKLGGQTTKEGVATLQAEIGRLETQQDLCAREQSAAEHDLDDLANQTRGATLKLHELATRRVLTADELKRTQSEIEAAAQQALAVVPLQQAVAEAEAELTLLREQYVEVARRRASAQPVRVDLWR